MTLETAVFDNSAKQMLEDLFGMSTGYVMDFNNGTFASFVQTCCILRSMRAGVPLSGEPLFRSGLSRCDVAG